MFNNIENKKELIELAANFFQTSEGRELISDRLFSRVVKIH